MVREAALRTLALAKASGRPICTIYIFI